MPRLERENECHGAVGEAQPTTHFLLNDDAHCQYSAHDLRESKKVLNRTDVAFKHRLIFSVNESAKRGTIFREMEKNTGTSV